MPNFVLNRNHTLRTTLGHIIDFKKGAATYVPPACVKAAVAIGAVCPDEEINVLDPEKAPPIPLAPEERESQIIAAFKLLEERAQRGDFNAAGAPTKTALVKILDFEVEKKEIDALWTGYTAEKNVGAE